MSVEKGDLSTLIELRDRWGERVRDLICFLILKLQGDVGV